MIALTELYRTEHLGAIRAVATASVVFVSALSPGLTGMLMGSGVALDTQLPAMAVHCFSAALGMGSLIPRLIRLAPTLAHVPRHASATAAGISRMASDEARRAYE